MESLKNMDLLELKEKISTLYAEKELGSLQYALKIGQVLVEVKERLGHGKFQSWLEDEFPQKYSTLASYKLIADNWETPRVKKMIEDGIITNITSFKENYKEESDSNPSTKKLIPKELQERNENVKDLCTAFRKHITVMGNSEIKVLAEQFDDEIWHRWEDILDEVLEKYSNENIKLSKRA